MVVSNKNFVLKTTIWWCLCNYICLRMNNNPRKHYSILLLVCKAFDGYAEKQTKACDMFTLARSVCSQEDAGNEGITEIYEPDVLGMRWRFLKSPSCFNEEERKGNQRRRNGLLPHPGG